MEIHTAMILAAGRGSRMRHLTALTPKPLLKVADKCLIAYHLEKLSALGMRNVVINVSYLGQQIQDVVGNGRQWGLNIQYSVEPQPLETAGGLIKALPLLGADPFLCINADVWTDLDFMELCRHAEQLPNDALADLVLVANPSHNLAGDFGLNGSRLTNSPPKLTFSGISILHPTLLHRFPVVSGRLGEVFQLAAQAGLAFGVVCQKKWCDVGTPERLAELDRLLSN